MPYLKVSTVGYKEDASDSKGYVESTFSIEIEVDAQTVEKLEQGFPLPDEYKPKLEKGWVDSPEKITKKPAYNFKPARPLAGIKVVK